MPKRFSPEKANTQTPTTIALYLERRGIRPSTTFGDYQDYIETQETQLPTKTVEEKTVPVEGNVHMSLGRFLHIFRC